MRERQTAMRERLWPKVELVFRMLSGGSSGMGGSKSDRSRSPNRSKAESNEIALPGGGVIIDGYVFGPPPGYQGDKGVNKGDKDFDKSYDRDRDKDVDKSHNIENKKDVGDF